MQLEFTTMPDWLHKQAMTNPDALALVNGVIRLTWRALDEQADQTASNLTDLGVSHGSHVAVLMCNSWRYAVLVHALMRMGAIMVPLNARLATAEVGWQIADSDASLVISDDANFENIEGAAVQAGIRAVRASEVVDRPPSADHNWTERRFDLSEVHSIFYTSGTTGRPKGAMITYGNHWWNAIGSALNLGTHRSDVWLLCMPMFHVGGMAILMRSVIYGVPTILLDKFDAGAVNRAIDEHGVTIVSVVATMLQRMIRERSTRPYPEALRCVLLGGGPAPKPLLEECAGRGIPVVQTYGLTETSSQAVTLSPQDALRKLGSVGKPLFPVEIAIEVNGERVRPGVAGEIVICGPNVTAGYYGRETDTARAIPDGWLHTRDAGYLDEEGYLYVLDRYTDLIVSGGENVYPAEVESAFLSHPDVVEACVTGLPDQEWGQRVAAALVVSEGSGVSTQELREYCSERLARYKMPSVIEFWDSLPRTASGKLIRHRVRESLLEKLHSETRPDA